RSSESRPAGAAGWGAAVADSHAAPWHHRPVSLASLAQRTRFSRQELQLMYRGFKNDCPSGLVHRAAFREIFSQFFPLGDASAYADLVFDSFDPGGRGCLTFEIVIQGLSVICKGSSEEKLDWAFRLYDTDRDGFISKREMVQLVSAIYDMLGDSVWPRVHPCDAQLHAEKIFDAMDRDGDGAVTFQEFVLACRRDRDLDRELDCFDTLL
uniref:Kv channel-interacting protein 2 n=1 Tax=Macrostomum lignano TaxID=282301 RepID=A0A1I8GD58_9PLAT